MVLQSYSDVSVLDWVVAVSILVGILSQVISAIWELLARALDRYADTASFASPTIQAWLELPTRTVAVAICEHDALSSVNAALYPLSSSAMSLPEHDASLPPVEMFSQVPHDSGGKDP